MIRRKKIKAAPNVIGGQKKKSTLTEDSIVNIKAGEISNGINTDNAITIIDVEKEHVNSASLHSYEKQEDQYTSVEATNAVKNVSKLNCKDVAITKKESDKAPCIDSFISKDIELLDLEVINVKSQKCFNSDKVEKSPLTADDNSVVEEIICEKEFLKETKKKHTSNIIDKTEPKLVDSSKFEIVKMRDKVKPPRVKKGSKVAKEDNNLKMFSLKKPKKVKGEAEETKLKFIKRKQECKKKIADGHVEKNSLRMFDFIFWNPGSNPMPGRETSPQEQSESQDEVISDSNDAQEENMVENKGLEVTNGISNETVPEEPNTPPKEVEDNEEEALLAPQVKIGPNGELIIDEKSLMLQTTAVKNRDEVLRKTEVVEETNDSCHYGIWSKRRKRSIEWTKKETARFYIALSTFGTDFSMMQSCFSWRSRAELKMKFKKEERLNRHLIDKALNDQTQFDVTTFDESDYNPEEDRKESKEEEKKLARKRKELERESRRLEKEKLKKEKKKAIAKNKKRKRLLKDNFKKKRLRKKRLESVNSEDDSTECQFIVDAKEVVCEIIFSDSEERISKKKEVSLHKPKTPEFIDSSNSEAKPLLPTEGDYRIPEKDCENIINNNEEKLDESNNSLHDEIEEVNPQEISITNGDKPTVEENIVTQLTFPVSEVKKNEDGSLYVNVDSASGNIKVPVPTLNPDTSDIIVMASSSPNNTQSTVFHVYLIAPLQMQIQEKPDDIKHVPNNGDSVT